MRRMCGQQQQQHLLPPNVVLVPSQIRDVRTLAGLVSPPNAGGAGRPPPFISSTTALGFFPTSSPLTGVAVETTTSSSFAEARRKPTTAPSRSSSNPRVSCVSQLGLLLWFLLLLRQTYLPLSVRGLPPHRVGSNWVRPSVPCPIHVGRCSESLVSHLTSLAFYSRSKWLRRAQQWRDLSSGFS